MLMLALAVSVLTAVHPAEAPGSVAPIELEPAPGPAPPASPPPEPSSDRSGRKGRGAIVSGSTLFALGSVGMWATAAGTRRLGAGRSPSSVGPGTTIGIVMSGNLVVLGTVALGLGARDEGRGRPLSSEQRRGRARRLRIAGGTLTGVGVAGLYASAVSWPRMRDACPRDLACGLGAVQTSTLALAGGVTMLGAAAGLHRRDRHLPHRTQTALGVGSGLFAIGFVSASVIGSRWEAGNDDAAARRVRQRSLIPLVGPWLIAGSPDVPLFPAAVFAGLGTAQLVGAGALTVAAMGAARDRGRRASERRWTVVPTGSGAAVVGQF